MQTFRRLISTAGVLFILAICTMNPGLKAQEVRPTLNNSVNVLFGLSQLTLDGFNIEGNLFYKRLAFDYSHGVSLNLDGNLVTGAAADQGLAIHIPYTTGFGVGYRFNNWLNLRLEPKWHRFELYYGGEEQVEANLIEAYNTFSLGLGLYGNLRPFKNQQNFLKGLMLAPSVRWWPRVSSSLADNIVEYENRITSQTEIHEALEVGIANTPWILNLSVGYAIEF